MFLMSEGMKARIISTTSRPIGSRSSIEGGGGSGGSMRGSISRDTVKQIITTNDSVLK